MAYIDLPTAAPGIVGLMNAYPATARHLRGLAQELLRGESSLTPAERELIAAYVSRLNTCTFCTNSHLAVARELWPRETRELVDRIVLQADTAPLSRKMQALVEIASAVQKGGRLVTQGHVSRAREAGADDKAIHDTVLIAAAFCMYNRYVDGLGTSAPEDPKAYAGIGVELAQHGYTRTGTQPH